MGSAPFEVNRLSVHLEKLKHPLRIAHLSDLHYGLYVDERALATWVDAALAAKPNLVLITGDFIDRFTWRELEPLGRQLARFGEVPAAVTLGVWGVWGNHDYARGEAVLTRLKETLASTNLTLLSGEGVLLRDDLYLAGVDDIQDRTPDLDSLLAARPPDAACLLMSHNPDILPDVPPEVDLVLCGHTHGGQVKLPWLGALRTSSVYGKRFLEGWIDEPGLARAYVSRGLGTTALPLRWNSPAELVVLELLPTT